MKKLLTLLSLSLALSVSAQQEYLPIYSDPMVFVDSTGRKVGELPREYHLLNTTNGVPSFGWARGMAPNTLKEGYIPAMHYQERQIAMFNLDGVKMRAFGTQYQGMTPLEGGFFLAYSQKEDNLGMNRKKYYFLNEFGQPVFEARGYDYADGFSEGMAAVKYQGKWYYINDLGHEVDLVPVELTGVNSVSSFHDGLSKIQIRKGKCGLQQCWRFVFINKKGEIVIDTDQLFPEREIITMANMKYGVSTIRFNGDPVQYGGYPYAYVDTTGNILFEHPNLFRTDHFNQEFLPVTEAGKDGPTIIPTEIYMINRAGERIDFPTIPEMRLFSCHYFSGPYVRLFYMNNTRGKPGASRIYNTRTQTFLYELDGTAMGIKWDLLSLRTSRDLRYWVVDLTTGDIVYDTNPENRIFYNWEEANKVRDKVRRFVAEEPKTLVYLHNLSNLQSLTLRNMTIEALPANLNFSTLQTLRVDGLMDLKLLPSQIKGLKKLSIRNCVMVENLMEMLEGQSLESLHLINLGLTPEQVSEIKAMYPNAQIVIEGKKEHATNELQTVYPDF